MGRKQIHQDNSERQRAYRARVQAKIHAKKIRAERIETNRKIKIENLVEISNGNTDLNIGKHYVVVYADPPWHYVNDPHLRGQQRGAHNHYPTMSTEKICALPVRDIVTKDAVLFMWVPNAMFEHP